MKDRGKRRHGEGEALRRTERASQKKGKKGGMVEGRTEDASQKAGEVLGGMGKGRTQQGKALCVRGENKTGAGRIAMRGGRTHSLSRTSSLARLGFHGLRKDKKTPSRSLMNKIMWK
eukprot:1161332-Pelagomonas_calceolata.AAC.8